MDKKNSFEIISCIIDPEALKPDFYLVKYWDKNSNSEIIRTRENYTILFKEKPNFIYIKRILSLTNLLKLKLDELNVIESNNDFRCAQGLYLLFKEKDDVEKCLLNTLNTFTELMLENIGYHYFVNQVQSLINPLIEHLEDDPSVKNYLDNFSDDKRKTIHEKLVIAYQWMTGTFFLRAHYSDNII